MDEGLGELIIRALFRIFKGKSNVAFAIYFIVLNIVLTIWILDTNSAYPIIGLIFVWLTVLGRIFRSIRQRSLHGIESEEEDQ